MPNAYLTHPHLHHAIFNAHGVGFEGLAKLGVVEVAAIFDAVGVAVVGAGEGESAAFPFAQGQASVGAHVGHGVKGAVDVHNDQGVVGGFEAVLAALGKIGFGAQRGPVGHRRDRFFRVVWGG